MCRLTENEHKKRQKVQKEKDEIGERIGPKITEKTENNGKSASLNAELYLFASLAHNLGQLTDDHVHTVEGGFLQPLYLFDHDTLKGHIWGEQARPAHNGTLLYTTH